jgi:hypothetical protein
MDRMKGDGEGGYHSYLLRVWSIPVEGGRHWRIVLEKVGTDEKHGFNSFEELLAYLKQALTSGGQTSINGD